MPFRKLKRQVIQVAVLFTATVTISGAQSVVKPTALALQPLPLTAVQPLGWLRQQLQIQASGLSGHVDEFWPDLGVNSAWRGGAGEGWERGPYYLDGLVPLAYLLNDATLIAKARPWIEWTLTHQQPNGRIGPVKNDDWWPNMLILKVLTQYQEATHDARVIPFMEKYFAYQLQQMDANPLREWAKYRWAEELLPIRWLYDQTKNPKLLDLAQKLHKQGYDWRKQFETFTFTTKVSREQIGLVNGVGNTEKALQAHGVNNAMALKMPTLWGFFSGDAADQKAVYQQISVLDRYHGQPTGMHSGDEHYAGLDPSQGVELCAVVEAMFSYEQLLSLLGDPAFGDRLEKITFNALPGTFSSDMWAHQYDQQPNQVLVSDQPRDWTTNADQSNLYGLEPHFGCCTANMHQGWPKFATSLWMATPGKGTTKDGLAAVAYAPCEVKTTVRGDIPVAITEQTEYPFRETIRLTINPARSTVFPLKLRIPAWATAVRLTVNGKPVSGPKAGTFYTLERQWKPGDQVELTFPMSPRTTTGYRKAVTLERGPLLFSLKIGEEWRKLKDRPSQADDYAVYPTTPWNYGLLLQPNTIQVVERTLGKQPFSEASTPVELMVTGIQLPQWTLMDNSAGLLPLSPVKQPSDRSPETLTLIPYGAAKLRVTMFPVVTTNK